MTLTQKKGRLFYGWVVVFAFLIGGTMLWGIRLAYGVFFKSLEAEFSLTRAATSSIFSVYMILGALCAIGSGWALDRYGPRKVILVMGVMTGVSLFLTSQAGALWQLFITYSLLLAVGTGGTYVVSMTTVSRWFNKRRGLALGIASTGVGTGTIMVPPFAGYFIEEFGWRTACLAVGVAILLITVPLSRLLKKDPYEIGAFPDGVQTDIAPSGVSGTDTKASGLSVKQAFRTRSLWTIMAVWFLFGGSIFLVLTHLVPHATDLGISPVEAATVLSLIGIGNIAGRVVMGLLADRWGRKASAILCALLQVAAILWLIQAHSLWSFYLFALSFGFAYGGITPGMTALVGDAFGLANLGVIMGVLDVGFGTGSALGPVMAGLIFDVSGSYFVAFLAGASAMAIVALLIFSMPVEKIRC